MIQLSPFSLHHSDSPKTILVTQPLTSNNYHTWIRSMSMALMANNKLGFVDGSLFKPTAFDDPLLLYGIQCNNIVIDLLILFRRKFQQV